MQDLNTLTIENSPSKDGELLDLYFNIPPNTNHVYRRRGNGVGMYMTDEGQSYKTYVARTIKEWTPGFAIPKKTPLKITFEFWLGSNRLNVNDWDGLIKLLQDAIFKTGEGNDAWVRMAVVVKRKSKDVPGCRVQLLILEQEEPING
jgi:Holliday junction resolvase RusA-like endonuclease